MDTTSVANAAGFSWIQAVVPSLLVIAGGIVTWFLKSRSEELRILNMNLLASREKIYFDVLAPIIKGLGAPNEAERTDVLNALSRGAQLETCFKLSLYGDDNVVKAFNEQMQGAFKGEYGQNDKQNLVLERTGNLLLAIRKSLGNKRTRLSGKDMLRGFITDIDKMM